MIVVSWSESPKRKNEIVVSNVPSTTVYAVKCVMNFKECDRTEKGAKMANKTASLPPTPSVLPKNVESIDKMLITRLKLTCRYMRVT